LKIAELTLEEYSEVTQDEGLTFDSGTHRPEKLSADRSAASRNRVIAGDGLLEITVWNVGVENVIVGLDRSTSVSEAFEAAWAMGVPGWVRAICLWQTAQAAVPTKSSRAASALVGHHPCPCSRCDVSSGASVGSCFWAPARHHSDRAATRK
jgi:hypothetical protein